jgi:Holliday junction resolvasome RuvABC DNA-binding subunit
MISQLTGVVVLKTQKYAVVETSGIGYKIFGTPNTLSSIKKDEMASLWIHMSVVWIFEYR